MKILIIDDSAVIRGMVEKMIVDNVPSAEIAKAKDGIEALSMIAADSYDAYTIDFNMPGADGEEVAAAAKAKSPNAKICMLTANKQKAIQDKASELGIEFFIKPHFKDDLISYLNS